MERVKSRLIIPENQNAAQWTTVGPNSTRRQSVGLYHTVLFISMKDTNLKLPSIQDFATEMFLRR